MKGCPQYVHVDKQGKENYPHGGPFSYASKLSGKV